jgi:hypothetical protein
VVQSGDVSVSDNCTVTTTHNYVGAPSTSTLAGASFPVGTTPVFWVVVDEGGNEVTCVRNIVITDNVAPLLTCASDQTVQVDAGDCQATLGTSADPLLASDNCGFTLSHNYISAPLDNSLQGAVLPLGPTTITWTIVDGSGNTVTCDVTVTVEDNEAPNFVNCPAGTITVGNDFANCSGGVNWSVPVAEDNCSVAAVTQIAGPAPGQILAVGTYDIAYRVEDGSGNADTCEFVVEVIDVQQPFIACPQDIAIAADAGVCTWTSPAGSLTPSLAIENCEPSLTYTVTNPDGTMTPDSGDLSGYIFDLGMSTVEYVLTDSSGTQTTSCSFTVTVEDDEAPVNVNCTAGGLFQPGFTLVANPGECVATLIGGLAATDNCGLASEAYIVFTRPDGTLYEDTLALVGGAYELAANDYEVGVWSYIETIYDESGNSTVCTGGFEVVDNELPVITCATLAASYDTDPGTCGYVVDGSEFDPTVSDNCEVSSVINDYNATSSLANASFPLGSTVVTWTVTDASGNTATCSISVVVEDNEAPNFVNCLAGTITVGNDFNNCSGGVNWSIPVAEDNCSVASVTQFSGPAPGQILSVGMYSIGYEVIDGSGNVDTCEFVVEVVDVQQPVIGCPQDITIGADAGACTWTSLAGSLTPSVALENCEPSLTYTVTNPDGSMTPDSGDVSGYTFALGLSTVEYVLTDSSGTQTTSCSFRVTVIDDQDPTITCPIDATFSVDMGTCESVQATLTQPTVNDNCSVNPVVTYRVINPDNSISAQLSNTTGYTFALGTSQVTWTVVDTAGNAATCIQNITVIDDENPTITCATLNSSYDTDAGSCDYTVNGSEFDPVLINDNCAIASVVNDYNATSSLANAVFPLGTTSVVWTVTDANGNTATCDITVLVEDNEAPSFVNCPTATITVGNDFANCSGGVSWSIPVAEDNCSVASVTQFAGPSPGQILSVGMYDIGYEVIDGSGNVDTCEFVVEVIDVQQPFIACPQDITIGADDNVCTWTSGAGSLTPSLAIENCEPSLTYTVTNPDGTMTPDSGDVSGYTFDLGMSTVEYVLTDSSGTQSTTCSFTVTIVDDQDPTITCPIDATFSVDMGTCASVQATLTQPTVMDNCSITPAVTYTVTNPDNSISGPFVNTAGYTFALGTSQVAWTVVDTAGNAATCVQNITVVDDEIPMITCATLNAAYDTDPGTCGYVVDGTEFDPTISDNCEVASLINNYNASSSLANATFPLGTTAVVWTVTDASGNTNTCSISVVVEDNEAPSFVNCPADTITVGNDFANCSGGVNWSVPVAEDNCSVASVTQFSGPSPGQILVVGTYNIGYEVIDGSGNVDTCEFVVEVVDVQDPFIACPQDITISADAGECDWSSQTGSLSPSVAIENCGPVLTWSVLNPDGSTDTGAGDVSGFTFELGESTVTYTLTNSTGTQSTSCSFRVTVIDTEAPEIVGCDNLGLYFFGSLSIPAEPGLCSATPALLPIIATDNCTDTLTADLIITRSDGLVITETLTQQFFFGFPLPFYFGAPELLVGVNTIEVVVSDVAGNESRCIGQIVVEDTQDPTITCPTLAAAYNTDPGSCDYTVNGTEFDPVLTDDNCEVVSIINNYNATSSLANETFPLGTTAVVWTVTDDSGNTTSCSITVVVEDNEAPSFVNCPADTITVGNDFANCSGGVNWSVPVAEDNCSIASLTQYAGPAPGQILNVGTYDIGYEVIDGSGNVDTCEFVVEVIDVQQPFIACPQDLTIGVDAGVCSWTSGAGSLSPSLAIENCEPSLTYTVTNPDGTMTPDSGDVSGYVFELGISTVEYTLTDSSGTQTTTCSFRVTVVDDEDPTIACPADATFSADMGTCESAQATLTQPGFSDNCSVNPAAVTYVVTNPDNSLSGPFVNTAGYTFALGISQVAWTVVDTAGNAATCIQNITVTDDEAPEVGCPMDMVFNVSDDAVEGDCGYNGTLVLPHPQDNCGISQFVYSVVLPDGSIEGAFDLTFVYSDPGLFGDTTRLGYFFPVGTSTVNILGEDASGNQSICSYTVTVNDDEAPNFINCPADTIRVGNDFANCSGGVNWSVPVAEDNCEIASVTQYAGPAPGQILAVGTYDIGYEVIDGSGNVDTCEFVVEVIDVQQPIIGCPQDITIGTDAGVCSWTSLAGSLTPSVAIENCEPSLTYTVTNPNGTMTPDSGDVSGYVFELGISTVEYVLTDSSGTQTTSCSFTVTVEDDEAPVIDGCSAGGLLQESVFTTNPGECATTLSGNFAASDNCGLASEAYIIFTRPNGTLYEDTLTLVGGAYELIANDYEVGGWSYVATVYDESGNSSVCSGGFEVIDIELPVITCATLNAAYDTDPGVCEYVVDGTEFDPTASDNCGISSVINDYNATSSLSNEAFPLGTTVVTWTVTDGSGNTATCSITVVVEDNEAPSFVNCPTDTITVGNDFANCSGGVNWSVPVAEDNCSVASVTQYAGPAPGQILAVGTYDIGYEVIDGSGNVDTCEFVVEVIDVQQPFIACPQDLTIGVDAGVCSWTSLAGSLTPSVAIENCEPSLTYTVTNPDGTMTPDSGDVSGYIFALGLSTVEYTLTDSSGTQTTTCSFRVTVVDEEDPTITCPSDVTFSTDMGTCESVQASLTQPVVSDNCSVNPAVTYTVTNPDNSVSGPFVNTAGYTFALGTSQVAWTVVDTAGNTAVCVQNITVIDDEAPVVNCPIDMVFNVSDDAVEGDCGYNGTLVLPHPQDNCGISQFVYSVVLPDGSIEGAFDLTFVYTDPGLFGDTTRLGYFFPVGTSTVNILGEDASGNQSICSYTVTVNDDEAPSFVNCPADTITVGNDFSNCEGGVNWSVPSGRRQL